MIIVNYLIDNGYNPLTDGYYLTLAGVVNDVLDLHNDIQLIIDCIDNSDEFTPSVGVMYELYLTRATIASDPVPEPAFFLDRIVKKKYDPDSCTFYTPTVNL